MVDAAAAVEAAARAAAGWRQTPPRKRSEILQALLRTDDRALAKRSPTLISLENGKALRDARGEVAYAAEFFRWNAEEAVRITGEFGTRPSGANRIIVDYQPIGICVLITPWNFPAAMATRKIAPALAAGCTVILKPASETPLTAYALAALYEEAGVPAGVVNVLTTTKPGPVTAAMLADPRVRKLSFTGSTGVGRMLLAEAAKHVISLLDGTGGNAPFIVFDDADLEAALDGAMIAKMRNAGEACTAANRIYVQRGIHDAFAEGLAEAHGGAQGGRGHRRRHRMRSDDHEEGRRQDRSAGPGRRRPGRRGSVRRLGRSSGDGFFYPPTVLIDVPADAAMAHEEIFGPVAPIIALRTEERGDRRGQRHRIRPRRLHLHRGPCAAACGCRERIEAGMIALNRGLVSDPAAPFGGVKQSGLGREGGQAARHRRVHGGEIYRRRDVDGGQVRRDPFNRDHFAPWVEQQNCGEVQSRQALRRQDRGD